jgi:nucleotide-binding universal stress UspA family protein
MMSATTAQSIVIGVDGSLGSQNAVRWGLALAERRHAPVRLIHAFDPPMHEFRISGSEYGTVGGSFEAARKLLDATYETAVLSHPQLRITSEFVDDGPASALTEASREAQAVVIGAHGVHGFTNLVAGSTTMIIGTHAHCTVIVLPTDKAHAFSGHGIVVGVDGSAISEAAIGYAFQQAAETDQELVAVHAWTDPLTPNALGWTMSTMYDPVAYARDQEILLAESLAGWSEKFPEVAVSRRVLHEQPVQGLTSAAQTAAMLVVGCRGLGAMRSMLLGSVSHGVMHLASCPVAVVHEHG